MYLFNCIVFTCIIFRGRVMIIHNLKSYNLIIIDIPYKVGRYSNKMFIIIKYVNVDSYIIFHSFVFYYLILRSQIIYLSIFLKNDRMKKGKF